MVADKDGDNEKVNKPETTAGGEICWRLSYFYGFGVNYFEYNGLVSSCF